MKHVARQLGESGFYHVVTKGDGSQIIFENERHRLRYLDYLSEALQEHGVKLHVYCLMSNHVHLLIQVDRSSRKLSPFMKRLSESYAMYFQRSTGRVGHVFSDRFWSEPVETDEQFLCTLRYIHANPEPAGLCLASDYPWSSYAAYCGKTPPVPMETNLALALTGGMEGFREFSLPGAKYATPFPGSKLQRHLSPDELWRIALALLGRDVLQTLRQMKPRERAPYVAALSSAGLSEKEIARVTGLGRQSIRTALSKN